MNNNIDKQYEFNNKQSDTVAQGFHRLDDKIVEQNPPRITWGKRFHEMDPARQMLYLKKLASTMNHAAYLIQGERDQLNELCAKKEGMLRQMAHAVEVNNAMVQTEVTKMNEQRQGFHATVARLDARIRELENGNND